MARPTSTERLIPFDVMPRILSAAEWARLRRGLEQRVKAINLYLDDVYGRREMLKAGIVPEDLVFQNPVFRPEMNGQKVPHDIYVHIAGIDIVRVDADTFYVLEDNARTPSGRLLHAGEPRDHDAAVPGAVRAPPRRAGRELSGRAAGDPAIGRAAHRAAPIRPSCCSRPASTTRPTTSTRSWPTSSASSWSRAAISFVKDDVVYMRTTEGPKRVDVIYRRIDDDFLDPLAFRPDSALGVPGLMSAYQAGNVTLANAVGTGIADDKAVYSYMPEIVKFYLGEEPILKNVPTWRCREPEHLAYVLDHLDELVVKEVHGSGGYGMLIGPNADKATIAAFRAKLKADPEELHRPADARALDLPDLRRGGRRAAPCRPAPVRAHRARPHPHRARRPDARRAEARLAGGQFEPGRRHQGHLGAGQTLRRVRRLAPRPAGGAQGRCRGLSAQPCSPAPPTTSTGSRATSSAPNISRASSRRRSG